MPCASHHQEWRKLRARKVSVMNTRHPVNPALKEEGGARTAHGLRGRSCDACVSSLAGGSRENPGQREGRRRTVEGRKRASWQQSTKVTAEPGEDKQVLRGAGGETPGGGSLPLTPPQKVPTGRAGCGFASTPLTSGWSREHTSCFT